MASMAAGNMAAPTRGSKKASSWQFTFEGKRRARPQFQLGRRLADTGRGPGEGLGHLGERLGDGQLKHTIPQLFRKGFGDHVVV
jgi:hypothetical protein